MQAVIFLPFLTKVDFLGLHRGADLLENDVAVYTRRDDDGRVPGGLEQDYLVLHLVVRVVHSIPILPHLFIQLNFLCLSLSY